MGVIMTPHCSKIYSGVKITPERELEYWSKK